MVLRRVHPGARAGQGDLPAHRDADWRRLFVADIQALDLTGDREGGLAAARAELKRIALDAQGGFPWDATRPPFPGLLAFQEEDAAIYFGRDDDIRRLIERLEARRAQGGANWLRSWAPRDRANRPCFGPASPAAEARRPQLDRRRRRSGLASILSTSWRAPRRGARSGGDWRKLKDDLAAPTPARALDGFGERPPRQGRRERGADPHPDRPGRGALRHRGSRRGPALPRHYGAGPLRGPAVHGGHGAALRLPGAASVGDGADGAVRGILAWTDAARSRPAIIQGPARVAGFSVEDAFVQQAASDAETEDALPLLAFALRELLDCRRANF